ncbi:hypothetical protein [Sphingobacterium tabacisoli]|uniref:Uncharacterized protein n=1 Tax=Sphingobacterium tabacisoli TaxID=2044855 RepID=A0ABW5L5L3_9SPHI|nr:hypothetical protein [Sphingobacterium tabacisoli]
MNVQPLAQDEHTPSLDEGRAIFKAKLGTATLMELDKTDNYGKSRDAIDSILEN